MEFTWLAELLLSCYSAARISFLCCWYQETNRVVVNYLNELNVFLKEELGEQLNLTMILYRRNDHSQHRPYQGGSQQKLSVNLPASQTAAELPPVTRLMHISREENEKNNTSQTY